MQDACMNGVWARIKSVRGCCGPIIDGKKKHLMSKTKINSYEPYLNVKNLYYLHVLILVEFTILFYFLL
jgi:hypothetical protein